MKIEFMTEEERLQLKERMEAKPVELKVSMKELKEASKLQGLDNAVGRLRRMDCIHNKAISESQIPKAEIKWLKTMVFNL